MLFKKAIKEEHEDHHDDLTETALYCRKTFCAPYENGWFECDIEQYNENICKYHASFNDCSKDYIAEEDIDMIEVVVF